MSLPRIGVSARPGNVHYTRRDALLKELASYAAAVSVSAALYTLIQSFDFYRIDAVSLIYAIGLWLFCFLFTFVFALLPVFALRKIFSSGGIVHFAIYGIAASFTIDILAAVLLTPQGVDDNVLAFLSEILRAAPVFAICGACGGLVYWSLLGSKKQSIDRVGASRSTRT